MNEATPPTNLPRRSPPDADPYSLMWIHLLDAVNSVGGVVERAGLKRPRFEPDALLARAAARAGLEDFGDERFREPFVRLVDAYASATHLTALGRIAAYADLMRLLTNRLRLVADRSRYPEIAEVEIRRPLFIVSLPRTGTTFLHGILAQDPRNRIPRSWEVMYPSPPPEHGSSSPDPRVARVRREFGWFHRMAPGYRAAHPIGAELAQECMAMTDLSFESPRFDRTHRLEAYRDWLDGRDRLHAYQFHRALLQHLSLRSPMGRWVLKNPPHSFWLDALWSVYPDARFIQTHRDPFTVVASFASHNTRLRRSFVQPDDVREGPVLARRWSVGVDRVMAFRDRTDVPEERWIDVHYAELVADPMGQLRRIYERFELELEGEAESAMAAFVREHPQYEHGIHDYDPRRYGLDPDEHGRLFDRYRARFGVQATEEDRRLARDGSKEGVR